MIIIFDLDDTLYAELTYVHSGFRAVSRYLRESCGTPEEDVFNSMCTILSQKGRGSVFDDTLRLYSLYSRGLVNRCLSVYRGHTPCIKLYPAAEECLQRLAGYPLYIVTDGNKMVQHRKLAALQLYGRVRRCFITHRFGLRHAKPGSYCFEKIIRAEQASPEEALYVGDNPAKDFVGIKPLGFRTVRVLTGNHRHTQADEQHEAHYRIEDLNDFTTDFLHKVFRQ